MNYTNSSKAAQIRQLAVEILDKFVTLNGYRAYAPIDLFNPLTHARPVSRIRISGPRSRVEYCEHERDPVQVYNTAVWELGMVDSFDASLPGIRVAGEAAAKISAIEDTVIEVLTKHLQEMTPPSDDFKSKPRTYYVTGNEPCPFDEKFEVNLEWVVWKLSELREGALHHKGLILAEYALEEGEGLLDDMKQGRVKFSISGTEKWVGLAGNPMFSAVVQHFQKDTHSWPLALAMAKFGNKYHG